eukprot:gb/GFBE01071253.1/.p1 GENE.gb/GFBE01071253.1/~~gb/GFBE01071253.1/.p1  ORF type:complete len:1041 (+),score=188.52 gb/GFBE01071253.1/:1-3123(+)
MVFGDPFWPSCFPDVATQCSQGETDALSTGKSLVGLRSSSPPLAADCDDEPNFFQDGVGDLQSIRPTRQISLPPSAGSDSVPLPPSLSQAEDADAVNSTVVDKALRGWLLCYGGAASSRAHLQPLAKASAGTLVAGLFWKKRYIELEGSQLKCWASEPGKARKGAKLRPLLTLPLTQLEEVALEGKTLLLAVRGLKVSLQVRADTASSASEWATAVKAAAALAISKRLPPGWDVEAMLSSGVGGTSAKLVNKEQLPVQVLPSFQQLLDHCHVCKATKDRREKLMPFRLEVADVVRVQNGAAWMDYSKARARVGDKLFSADFQNMEVDDSSSTVSQSTDESARSPRSTTEGSETDHSQTFQTTALESARSPRSTTDGPPVLTSSIQQEELMRILGEAEVGSNEHWLFHGTSAAAVQGISDREFRLDKAGSHRGTMYGKGIYFAECSTKADEYSEEDEEGYCWMLLCRVTLGNPLVCRDKKPPKDILEQCQSKGKDSLIGDRWAAVGTFREFILFDSNQVYPAFILRYKRWTEASLARTIREVADAGNAAESSALFPHVAILAEEHPDAAVRYRLSLLMGARAQAVVPRLCGALSDPRKRYRLNAAKALMNMAGQCTGQKRVWERRKVLKGAVPALTNALEDPDKFVRTAAARALERLGSHASSAVPALVRALHDTQGDVRVAAATALGQLGAAAAEQWSMLVEAADDPVEQVRVSAVTSLGQLSIEDSEDVEAVFSCLVQSLDDASSDVRTAAASAIGAMLLSLPLMGPRAKAVAALAERLSDVHGHVRAAAASSLGQIGGAPAGEAVSALLVCLKDSEHLVRKATAVALGMIGSHAERAASALADCLRDEYENAAVREAAATWLSRLTGGRNVTTTLVVQALCEWGLTDGEPSVRKAAAEALTDMVRLKMLGGWAQLVEDAMMVRLKDESDDVNQTAQTCLKLFEAEGHRQKRRTSTKRSKKKPLRKRSFSGSSREGGQRELQEDDESSDNGLGEIEAVLEEEGPRTSPNDEWLSSYMPKYASGTSGSGKDSGTGVRVRV